jgi:tetratricopeptide (TPR) repeat protein
MHIDWFRRTTWTKEDEEEFFQKLKRAHKHKKPQYLRIQASTLYYTDNYNLLPVAKSLLEKYFSEYPDDKSFRTVAFNLLGHIYRAMKKHDTALENYRNAVEFEKEYPQVKTDAYLNYSELVVELNKTELFKEVKTLLLEQLNEIDLPKNKYIKAGILSIIYKHENDMENAEYYKKLAEEAANAENSDFRWHRKLGLVETRNELLDKLMK